MSNAPISLIGCEVPWVRTTHEPLAFRKEQKSMESLKQEALEAISRMSASSDIDDIMYRLYVIDKVRKGREAVQKGDVVAAQELRKEMESW